MARCFRSGKELCENDTFAPPGLVCFLLVRTAYAVGFILKPLRGKKSERRSIKYRTQERESFNAIIHLK